MEKQANMLRKWWAGYHWYRKEYKKASNIISYISIPFILAIPALPLINQISALPIPALITGICVSAMMTLRYVDEHERKLAGGN